ncbi:MAG: ABC transporter permease subunit [Clostridiales Family XIII bacterium]|jgi:ABC-type transport system involved in multi-copper enzyme maturation permease subunit|nr:ABC transporter permease subunit [Clostridiales Family XIII bacterium]
MSLFGFELRKLLFNKRTLLIAAAMAVVYAAIGFGTSYFLVGSGEAYKTYSALAAPVTGPLDARKADEALQSYEALKDRFGDNPEMIYYGTSSDPVLKFDVDYANYTGYVNEYHNGAASDSLSAPYGVNVLRGKLTELARDGKTNTFEYRSVKNQLDKETALGEPRFANTVEWGNLFTNWGDTLMLFVLFIPLAFIISSVFSREASTGMDNLILSSRNGRRKIVTAKIGAVAVTAAILLGIYLLATFGFGFLAVGTLEGWDAALRSVPAYVRAPFGFTNLQFTLVSALWVLLSGTVYALVVAFISSRLKSQMAALGVSLLVLFLNIGIAALGTGIQSALQWLSDFGVASFALVGEVFAGYKVYNVFGFPVPYYGALLVFMGAVIALASLGMYIGQRRRTVA